MANGGSLPRGLLGHQFLCACPISLSTHSVYGLWRGVFRGWYEWKQQWLVAAAEKVVRNGSRHGGCPPGEGSTRERTQLAPNRRGNGNSSRLQAYWAGRFTDLILWVNITFRYPFYSPWFLRCVLLLLAAVANTRYVYYSSFTAYSTSPESAPYPKVSHQAHIQETFTTVSKWAPPPPPPCSSDEYEELSVRHAKDPGVFSMQ